MSNVSKRDRIHYIYLLFTYLRNIHKRYFQEMCCVRNLSDTTFRNDHLYLCGGLEDAFPYLSCCPNLPMSCNSEAILQLTVWKFYCTFWWKYCKSQLTILLQITKKWHLNYCQSDYYILISWFLKRWIQGCSVTGNM